MDAASSTSRINRSWQRATSGLGWAGDSSELREQLLSRYTEPHRRYHTQQHLSECLAVLEPGLDLAEHPAEVEMALWFHDAVYETRRRDNESQSAAWARSAVRQMGSPDAVATRIHELVLATQHSALPTCNDAALLVDVDLAILAAPASRFTEYEQQIRAEYAFVPGWLFRHKRRVVLRSFLQRKEIYRTSHFRAQFEAPARHNLQTALDA